MKNTLTAIAIFASLIIFVYICNASLLNLCDTITESSEKIELLIDDRNWDAAASDTQDIINLIDEKTIITAVYIHHSDFDDLMEEAVELSLYVDCEDHTEALVAVNSLKNFAKNIKHLHQATIENIF